MPDNVIVHLPAVLRKMSVCLDVCALWGPLAQRLEGCVLNHSRPQVDSEFTFVYNVRKVTAWWKREWPKIRKQFCYSRCH